jgi:putative transposase
LRSALTSYAKYFNRIHRKMGHVFQGRYRAILCQKESYLLELVRYIHLNPVRAHLVESPQQGDTWGRGTHGAALAYLLIFL